MERKDEERKRRWRKYVELATLGVCRTVIEGKQVYVLDALGYLINPVYLGIRLNE